MSTSKDAEITQQVEETAPAAVEEGKRRRGPPSGIEEEAEEVEGEEEEEGGGGTVATKKTGRVEEDEEEEEEGQDEFEDDGFVVDVVEEEEEEDAEKKQRPRKKKRKTAYVLDEADIDLIREAHPELAAQLPVGPDESAGQAPGQAGDSAGDKGSKPQLKRLRKAAPGGEKVSAKSLRKGLQKKLFGKDAPAAPATAATAAAAATEQDIPLSEEEEDGLDDFIVDEQGRPMRRSEHAGAGGSGGGRGIAGVGQAAGTEGDRLRRAVQIFGGGGAVPGHGRRAAEDGEDGELEELDDGSGGGAGPAVDGLAALQVAFEPAVLENRYLTREDEAIRARDVPERLQLRFADVPGTEAQMTPAEIAEEAEWIYRKAFDPAYGSSVNLAPDRTEATRKIGAALSFIRNDLFEVPFIAAYRSDFTSGLQLNHLWEVYDLDAQYSQLGARRRELERILQTAGAAAPDAAEAYGELVRNAESEAEVQDLFDHLNLRGATGPEAPGTAIRRDLYSECRRAGIAGLAAAFGMTAKQLGENLELKAVRHLQQDPAEAPEVAAARFVCAEFPLAEDALRAARHMLAKEIAFEPKIRQSIRLLYDRAAIVNTAPTPARGSEVDAWHRYACVKRLRGKTAADFLCDASFVALTQAEQEGFIVSEVAMRPETHADICNQMRPLYLSVGTSAVSRAWNDQRALIIEEALSEQLYPLLARQLRERLLAEAGNRVMHDAAAELETRLITAPFLPQGIDNERARDIAGDIRVAAFALADSASDSATPTVVCVLVGPNGEPGESIRLEWITLPDRRVFEAAAAPPPGLGAWEDRPHSHLEEDQRKRADREKLSQWWERNVPEVAAVAASGIPAKRLYEELQAHFQREGGMPVKFVDPTVAKVFAQSERGRTEFPAQSALYREAVSVGRLLQDPLPEYAGLCSGGSSKELLCLAGLHPYAGFVTRTRPARYAEVLGRRFIDVVCHVGVDVNRAANHKHLAAQLQFVAGLGPRKAAHLIHAVFARGGILSNRKQLEDILGPVVARNCAAFLRIRSKYLHDNEEYDLLDDSRIHPEFYPYARKLAADTLDRQMSDRTVIRDIFLRSRSSGSRIEDSVNIESFAASVDAKYGGKHRELFFAIAKELDGPFKEIRNLFADIDSKLLFQLLTGQSVHPGEPVLMRVTSSGPKGCRGTICGGAVRADLEPDPLVSDPESGSALLCCVKSFNELEFTATLSSGKAEQERFEKEQLDRLKLEDSHLSVEPDEIDARLNGTAAAPSAAAAAGDGQEKEREKKAVTYEESTFVRFSRAVRHPLFENASPKEVLDKLRERPAGSVLIRPSTREPDVLTLSWKVGRDVVMHINITEQNKANALTIGKRLVVGEGQVYEDLDELNARFVEPLNSFLQEATTHRSFRAENDTKAEIDRALLSEKEATPSRIPYYVSLSHDRPGALLLSYLPGHTPRHEYAAITPDGFRFRKQPFKKLDALIKWFKLHWKEPIPGQQQHQPSLPADRQVQEQAQPQDWARQIDPWESGPDHPITSMPIHDAASSASGSQPMAQFAAAVPWSVAGSVGADAASMTGSASWASAPPGAWGQPAPSAVPAAAPDSWSTAGGSWGVSQPQQEPSTSFSQPPPGREKRGCFKCGVSGHLARNCPTGGGSGSSFGGGSSRGSGCYNCGQPGHISRDCPKKSARGRPSSTGDGETGFPGSQPPAQSSSSAWGGQW